MNIPIYLPNKDSKNITDSASFQYFKISNIKSPAFSRLYIFAKSDSLTMTFATFIIDGDIFCYNAFNLYQHLLIPFRKIPT